MADKHANSKSTGSRLRVEISHVAADDAEQRLILALGLVFNAALKVDDTEGPAESVETSPDSALLSNDPDLTASPSGDN